MPSLLGDSFNWVTDSNRELRLAPHHTLYVTSISYLSSHFMEETLCKKVGEYKIYLEVEICKWLSFSDAAHVSTCTRPSPSYGWEREGQGTRLYAKYHRHIFALSTIATGTSFIAKWWASGVGLCLARTAYYFTMASGHNRPTTTNIMDIQYRSHVTSWESARSSHF